MRKVICEYCGSYIDADQNETCPRCGAPLSEAIHQQIISELKGRINCLELQNAMHSVVRYPNGYVFGRTQNGEFCP